MTSPRASPRWTTTESPARSWTAPRSGAPAPPSRTAASRPRLPEATAIATHTSSALSRSDGRSTAAAAYVRPSRSRTAAPSTARVRAIVARASVTSFWSSAERAVMPTTLARARGRRARSTGPGRDNRALLSARVGLGLVAGEPADQHALDLVATSGRRLGDEAEPVGLDVGPGDRHPAEELGHQPADGVDVVVLDFDPDQLVEVVDRVARRHSEGPVGQLGRLDLVGVVLVGDLADDLLEQVLDGDQPGGAAVLVDDDGDVLARGLHLRQQGINLLGLRHVERRPHHLLDALGELHLGRLEVTAYDVLEVGEADDVVEVLADDRHP